MARNRFQTIARDAAQKTNAELASELTEITRLTERELREAMPRAADRQRFAQLMAIVASSTSEQRKLVKLRENLDELGPIVLKALKLLT